MSHQSAAPVPEPQPGGQPKPDDDQTPASDALTDANFDPREATRAMTQRWQSDWRSRQHS